MNLNVLTIHFAHSFNKILGALERDEAVALGLAGSFVAHDSCFLKSGILGKGPGQGLVGDLVAQVATEEPKVVRIPLGQGLVLPDLASARSHKLARLLLVRRTLTV